MKYVDKDLTNNNSISLFHKVLVIIIDKEKDYIYIL